MRRRLDLALSFVVTPEVLFLDEPTTGLDTRSRRELWDVIRSLADAGTTVFLTTQYLEEADQLADRIAVLDGGRIVAEGTPTSSRRASAATWSSSATPADCSGEVPTDGTRVRPAPRPRRPRRAGGGGRVTLRRPTLDDVFLALTDRDARAADTRRKETA